MPPKFQFTRDEIIDAAFAIAREEGTPHITTRAIADRLRCSTSPIYSHFNTIDKLEDEVSKRFADLLMQYLTTERTGSPLMDIALGYILFASEEQILFRFTYMNRSAMRPISLLMIEKNRALLLQRLQDTPELSGLSSVQIPELMRIGWAFIHGIATQLCIGLLTFRNQEEILAMIDRVKEPLIEKMRRENENQDKK